MEASAYNSEIDDLQQRLLEVEEKSISLEHEAQQWKETVEQVETAAKERVTSLQEQLEEKVKTVEQLISKDSEHQLEIDKLRNEHQLEIDKVCAENKALKERLRDEPQSSASVSRTTEWTDSNEASLHNVTKPSFPPQGATSPLSQLSSLSISSLASVNSDEIAGLPVSTSMPTLTSAPLTNTFTVGMNPVAQPFSLSH